MNSKFTILTASYNHKKYLKDWAKSVLSQTYRPLEVVFVDDHSDTKDIEEAEKYREEFENAGIEFITYRNEENLHCASTYIKALELATGDFFGVLDSDDSLFSHAVEDVMHIYSHRPEIGYIYTQFDWCDINLKRKRTGFSKMPPTSKGILAGEFTEQARHVYSHWRTFSNRVPDVASIFHPNRKCSIDKYMGYRLEELAPGMFYKKVCYKYRAGVKQGITKSHNSIAEWKKVRSEAHSRRKRFRIKRIYPIVLHKQFTLKPD